MREKNEIASNWLLPVAQTKTGNSKKISPFLNNESFDFIQQQQQQQLLWRQSLAAFANERLMERRTKDPSFLHFLFLNEIPLIDNSSTLGGDNS